jgi:DNA replication protein DnaC
MSLEEFKARAEERQAQRKAAVEDFIASQPQEVECGRHPGQKCTLALNSLRKSLMEYGQPEFWQPKYAPCPLCREDAIREKLTIAGVPDNLLSKTFDNFIPRTAAEQKHLACCREFAEKDRKGLLALLGPVGVGKSHLAVAMMRAFLNRDEQSVFINQSTLLRELRATYDDSKARDPIQRCQTAGLLVLDEMGFSGGGRDEAPMIYEIFDFRYGKKKPTIITTNLSWQELQTGLGERLNDRIRECIFAVLAFDGPSHRQECRAAYFA